MISCLRRAGVEVVERHVPVWEGREHKWSAGPAAAVRLAGAEARLLRRPQEPFDAIVVGYPGHADLRRRGTQPAGGRSSSTRSSHSPTRSSPTAARFRPESLAARALAAVDRHAFRAADLVVADTAAHAEHLFRADGRTAS